MQKRFLAAGYRFFFALLVAAAIITQYVHVLARPEASRINFFFFFTVESNILAMIILAVAGVFTLRGREPRGCAMWRGAATLYMVITGIVYALLLSGLEDSLQTPIPWVNSVLHYIMPLAVLLDWCLWRPKSGIRFKRALLWLVFPLLYGVVSLVRGHFVGWYPYPFLDPAIHGYAGVAIVSICIAAAAITLTAVLVWISRYGQRKPMTKQRRTT